MRFIRCALAVLTSAHRRTALRQARILRALFHARDGRGGRYRALGVCPRVWAPTLPLRRLARCPLDCAGYTAWWLLANTKKYRYPLYLNPGASSWRPKGSRQMGRRESFVAEKYLSKFSQCHGLNSWDVQYFIKKTKQVHEKQKCSLSVARLANTTNAKPSSAALEIFWALSRCRACRRRCSVSGVFSASCVRIWRGTRKEVQQTALRALLVYRYTELL